MSSRCRRVRGGNREWGSGAICRRQNSVAEERNTKPGEQEFCWEPSCTLRGRKQRKNRGGKRGRGKRERKGRESAFVPAGTTVLRTNNGKSRKHATRIGGVRPD